MKKLLFVILLSVFNLSANSTTGEEQLKAFKIPEYKSLEEYQKLVGKVFTFLPVANKYNKKMVDKFKSTRRFKIKKINMGRKQKKSPGVIRLDWKIVDIATKEEFDIVVYLGDHKELEENYNDLIWDDEVRIYDLPIYNFVGSYNTTLSKVEKPENPEIQFGEIRTITDSLSKYKYEDNVLDITLFGKPERIYFELKNKSQHSLKLLWDEASFVDISGKTSKIMHNGIKYSERENSQAPSTIIRGASLDDVAVPTNNVYFLEKENKWKVLSMYPDLPFDNRQITLMLPIQIKGVTNEYLFIFDMTYDYEKVIK